MFSEGIIMVKALLCIAGTAGFCVVLGVSRSKLIVAVLGGAVSAFTAAILENAGAGIFKTTLVAMIALCVFSEIAARAVKTPAAVIMIPGSIPLLPGGSLYYMMSGDLIAGILEITEALVTALAIVLGFAAALIVFGRHNYG